MPPESLSARAPQAGRIYAKAGFGKASAGGQRRFERRTPQAFWVSCDGPSGRCRRHRSTIVDVLLVALFVSRRTARPVDHDRPPGTTIPTLKMT